MIMSVPRIHPRLAHLTPDRIDELVARYYARTDKVGDLMKEFGISGNPSSFLSLLPPIVHVGQHCHFCSAIAMVSDRTTRDRTDRAIPYCPTCRHVSEGGCRCANCERLRASSRAELETKKRAAIEKSFPPARAVERQPEGLTQTSALYILALLRHSVTEDLRWASPYQDKKEPLVPTWEMRKDVVQALLQAGLIGVSAKSATDAFVYDDAVSHCPSFYLNKVIWEFLPGMSADAKRQFVFRLEQLVRNGPWPDGWATETDVLWRTIAKAECFEYYTLMLDQRGFEAEIGPKTHAVFDDLLTKFSIGQIFYMTWSTARNTTDFIVKEGTPKYIAKNFFIGAIQRMADRAIAEKWDLRHSRRDYARPQSYVSAVFFDAFIKVGDISLSTVVPSTTAAAA
jgi:hypothetical protein